MKQKKKKKKRQSLYFWKVIVVVDEVDGHSSLSCYENSSNLLLLRLPYPPPPAPPLPPPLSSQSPSPSYYSISPFLASIFKFFFISSGLDYFLISGRTNARVSEQLGSCQDNFGIRAPVGMAFGKLWWFWIW
ncbi:hypothetical protein M0804_011605 [Polistes exclamans]|nr:hypothetical protein M0804_011605 [Polistes exclamans]